MISSGLVVDGSPSLGPSLHFAPPHMSFEPFLKGSAASSIPPVPEFLRPLPKPAPLVPRYNGNRQQHPSLPQHKEDPPVSTEDTSFPSSIYNSRLFPPPPPTFSHYPLQGPYGNLYPTHYTPFRDRPLPTNPNPPVSPLEAYPGPQSPRYSPPAQVKPGQSLLKDKKFKVPSGKEGSLKHRILTTRPDAKKKRPSVPPTPSELPTSSTPPSTPSFNKGSLIQLANGELRKVEDMRTEDFVSSAEKSPGLRLDPSTVVRIDTTSCTSKGYNLLTLSYGENRNQVSAS